MAQQVDLDSLEEQIVPATAAHSTRAEPLDSFKKTPDKRQVLGKVNLRASLE